MTGVEGPLPLTVEKLIGWPTIGEEHAWKGQGLAEVGVRHRDNRASWSLCAKDLPRPIEFEPEIMSLGVGQSGTVGVFEPSRANWLEVFIPSFRISPSLLHDRAKLI